MLGIGAIGDCPERGKGREEEKTKMLIPDDPRIRNAEMKDPPVAFRCECCGAPVYVGDDYWQTDEGALCFECGGDSGDCTARLRTAEEPEPRVPEPDEYEGR